MPIKYAIYQNNLNDGKTGYYAKAISSNSLNTDEIIDIIANRGTTVTKTDVQCVLEILSTVIEDELKNGATIRLPFANFSTVIKGKFKGYNDKFVGSRHTISASVSLGKRLKKSMREMLSVQKTSLPEKRPSPRSFSDISSGTQDMFITPGGPAIITGKYLRFDLSDPKQGIFLINAQNRKDSKRVSQIGKNEPGELFFKIPDDLQPAVYEVAVLSTINGSLRRGVLQNTLIASEHQQASSDTLKEEATLNTSGIS